MSVPHMPDDLATVARRMVWYEEPKQALRDPVIFLAHLMTYGTIQDVITAEKYFTPEHFLQALQNAPPGVFDARSWAYWNTVFGRVPVPPMPRRHLLEDAARRMSTETPLPED